MKLILTIFLSLLCLNGSARLKSGAPLPAGGKNALAPMSFGMAYSNHPLGFAFVDGTSGPDVFIAVRSGMPQAKGLWHCTFQGVSQSGCPIYCQESRVETPWDSASKLPGKLKVYQDGDRILLLKLSKTKLTVCQYDSEEGFEMIMEQPLAGMPEHITSFDCIRRTKSRIEIALLCNDGTKYRPETFKGDTRSYYDGAGMYRGQIPHGGIMKFMVNNDWKQVSEVVAVTDLSVMTAPSEIACVSNASMDGYVISNSQGCLKFADAATGAVDYIHDNEGRVMQHRNYACKVIAYPSVDGTRSDLYVGGEGADYLYRYGGLSWWNPPVAILERQAPLYGGSLTVPNVCDWDGDGADDIVAGNSEGRLLFFKNNGTNEVPDFALPVEVVADGKPLLLRPGYYVVQGPLEGAWGYLCPTVYDWNSDGLLDIVTSGSRAKFEVFLNIGTATEPVLDEPFTLMCDGLELHGSWRVRPAITEIGGRPHIVIMDDSNALHLYRQCDLNNVEDMGRLKLTDGRQITGHNNASEGLGQWGRGKLRFFDWDGDGDADLFVGSVKRSSYPSPDDGLPYRRFKKKQFGMQVMLFINEGGSESICLAPPVQLQFKGEDFYLGAHSNAPEPCWFGDVSNGPNLLVGCESGKYFFFEHNDLTHIK